MVLMPTDGGPTNLPMFESFYFKKILFYSDHLIDKDDELNNFLWASILENQRIFIKKLFNFDENKKRNGKKQKSSTSKSVLTKFLKIII